MVKAIRGAIQVSANAASDIHAAGARIVAEILQANDLSAGDLISLLFSMTRDLTAANPAAGARRQLPGLSEVPLFCVQEAEVDGGLPRVVRVLATFRVPPSWRRQSRSRATPVYLDGAGRLRPDLAGGEQGEP